MNISNITINQSLLNCMQNDTWMKGMDTCSTAPAFVMHWWDWGIVIIVIIFLAIWIVSALKKDVTE